MYAIHNIQENKSDSDIKQDKKQYTDWIFLIMDNYKLR